MPDLTESDYDALFAVMQADLPRIWREIFPHAQAQLEGTGVLTISVSDDEITVNSTKAPAMAGVQGEEGAEATLTKYSRPAD